MMTDLVRWNPFDELQKFSESFDRMFDRMVDRLRSGFTWNAIPSGASLGSLEDGYRVRIPLPGIAPENVTVDVAGRTVHVRAVEREGDTEVTRYEEMLTLPSSVDADKIAASFRYGLLELNVPFLDAVKPRRIEIATTESKQLKAA